MLEGCRKRKSARYRAKLGMRFAHEKVFSSFDPKLAQFIHT